jgi:murein DD-endopeptidase MepM/ murein hydrolase activator NlpD
MWAVQQNKPQRSGRFTILALLAAGLALAVGGCTRGAPAPVYQPAGAVGINPTKVIVQVGDTVYAIANRFGVPVRDLIQANFLLPPYGVRPGRVLKLPSPGIHVVTGGDTLYGVSRLYGIDMTSLARLNRMKPPYTILVGQKLRLPNNAKAVKVAAVENPIKLKRPAARTPGKKPPAPRKVQPKAEKPPPRSGARFAWPVRGAILSSFGAKKGGLYNDGINIAAKRGEKVRAAENGVVAYAGNELRGFGNLLLIRHQGGWMTAYAHAEKLLVKRGQTVKRRQVIGYAGSSGSVAKPQVHFEIRKGSRAVDPLKYLSAISKGAGGISLANVMTRRYPHPDSL